MIGIVRTPTRSTRPDGSPGHRPSPWPLAAAVTLVLAACSAGGSNSDGAAETGTTVGRAPTTTVAATSTTEPSEDEEETNGGGAVACLPEAEVEAVVGETDGRNQNGGGSGGTDLSFSYQGCSYELVAGGSVSVTRVTEADPLDGSIFDSLDRAAAADFETDGLEQLDDLGDDAYRMGTDIAVLYGPQLFTVAVSPNGEFGDSDTDAAIEVAGAVLDVDLSEDPLDCVAVGSAIATTDLASVAEVGPSGGAIGVDDVSISLQGCQIDLEDGAEVTVLVSDGAQWQAWITAESGSIFTAHYQAKTVGEHTAFDDGDSLVVDDDDQPLRIATDDVAGSAEELAELRLAVAEMAVGY